MIFEEKDNGMTIEILHKELMNEDIVGFLLTILHGRQIYQRNHHADMDDDDSDGE